MRLKTVTIKNFRCYREEINIDFSDLTTFVGRNDIGKSTVLEALEIFFNNSIVSIEQSDAHVHSGIEKVEITCEFTDFPDSLTLDAGAETSLAEEFLLTDTGTLKLRKIYDCGNKKPSLEIFVLANHPSVPGFQNLLELKEKDLQAKVRELKLDVSLKGNPRMRKAIWAAGGNLQLVETAIPVSKAKEDAKRIWDQIESYLPMFALFQSDRSSKDSDDEVQSPMKVAVAAALAEVQADIARIQQRVQEKAEEIAQNTHEALKTIDPGLASELSPEFTPPTAAKWLGLFSIGLNTDSGIPLNKRGSGIRRLVLVSFFKAEAERRLKTSNRRSIIYAIEEPETAQHPNNQRILIESFKSLASEAGCQVVLTTHSPGFAAELPNDSIRFIFRDSATGKPVIQAGVDVFGAVAETLGVTPDSRVKVLLCLEGPTDVSAFKALSKALHAEDNSLPNLENDGRVAFIVLGGGNLKHWVDEHYLRGLSRKEVHIYDGDVASYAASVATINARGDGSWAVQTIKHEIESYLHSDAINEAFNVIVEVTDHPVDDKATPKRFAEAYSAAQNYDGVMKDGSAKIRLAERAFPLMTAARIHARDPEGEVVGWMRRIRDMIQ
ncbi:ATP-binding protein [Comamonas avium]|uniref:ATP-binding protein n=1 Tax=Comamonas avium TaxID=2762231 RepID=A0ABR8SGC1_9BURK|nr:ATP-binding protein [Comamonas avium]MBD7962404.1 ATP-binding protein [Comamonas avium]